MPHFPNEYLMDVVEGNVCDIKSMIPLFAETEGKEIVLIDAAAIIDIRSNVSPLTYQVNVVGTKKCGSVGFAISGLPISPCEFSACDTRT